MDKKSFIFVAIIAIVMIVSLISLNSGIDDIQKTRDHVKSLVGSRILFEKDTVTIVDYSMFDSNYTLSNGKKASFDFVNKCTVIKK